jgi:dipeptide transport system ATP-binding protein
MLLEVKDLSISFDTLRGDLKAIDQISFSIREGEVLGIVGESGCGKSITSLAVMGLLPKNANQCAGKFEFAGRMLSANKPRSWRKLRGKEIAMIFQDPMTSLDPCFTIGYQLMETLKIHEGGSYKARWRKAHELLERVGIPDVASQLNSYPHELSGGMCQRVMIAMAIACKPKLLIADEPTTALDVTIQAQILSLLKSLQTETRMAMILITHDMAVVSAMADRIAVMYAGQIVETGPAADIIHKPHHPYTQALLECLPEMHDENETNKRLPSITGLVPDLVNRPLGCQLHPRCRYANDRCRSNIPEMTTVAERSYKCFEPVNMND